MALALSMTRNEMASNAAWQASAWHQQLMANQAAWHQAAVIVSEKAKNQAKISGGIGHRGETAGSWRIARLRARITADRISARGASCAHCACAYALPSSRRLRLVCISYISSSMHLRIIPA